MIKARVARELGASLIGAPADHERAEASGRMPRAGDIIAGKYSVVRLLGEGGMAVVYEAEHLRLRQRLAIKVLRPDMTNLEDVLARFEREARATAQLRSVHTARIVDVDTLEGGLPYIVMEYLDGADLDATLRTTGVMAIDQAIDIALQVAEAMAEAHRLGIVHRDLKPANLFLCNVGDRRVVKVLDFGISKTAHEDDGARLTHAHTYFGTPCYTAPEQLRSAIDADARSDIWSLGIILFELLTGNPPFHGGGTVSVIARVMTDPVPWPGELRRDLPPELACIVMRALERDPAERFQTMGELSEALAPFGPKEKAAALLEARPRGRLGEILVADGLLSEEDLRRALQQQRQSGTLLGRVLLDMGLVAQTDLLTALAKQQGIAMSPTTAVVGQKAGAHAIEAGAPRRRRVWLFVALAAGLAVASAAAGAMSEGSSARATSATMR